ncbi:MAG: Ig-like domain-containing protein [Candidatus Poribacteria bacterium]|nr:Ig-like domain-containing protein [Candidatus Poribacteria bacterium]
MSLNTASGRQFVEGFINQLAPPGLTIEAEVVVNAILDEVPRGFLPKKQIRQILLSILLSRRLTAFPKEADNLDTENFGNAITPNFADFLYTDFGTAPNQKYLTSDGLHVYTRVPAKVDRVEFGLSDGPPKAGTEVKMEGLGADTIPYTFRLEETLAATNLPAWPGLDNTQLFSEVRLRYSTNGPNPEEGYFSKVMTPTDTGNGVVWEESFGIPTSGSVYYFFEVELIDPLYFTTLDRDAIAALDPTTVTLADVFDPANLHKIRIDGWAMPDPRNLQLTDRGILGDLFTPNLGAEFSQILTSPQVLDVVSRALAGQQVNINDILNVATPKQLNKIRKILVRNANALITQFENEFNPRLASVFTVPRVDLATHSLWTARIDNIADGNYQLKVDVLHEDGTVLDRIQENITVDTSAPEAGIGISPSDANATGYWNDDDDIFVATAPTAGTAAMLNIMGMPKAADIGPGAGYLFYQMIGLNEDGTPYLGEPSTYQPNTWMPLTVDSTMLVSNIWEAVKAAVAEGELDAPSDPILQAALASPLSVVLGILNADLIQQFAGPFLKDLEPYIGFSSLSESQAQLIVEALGPTIDIVDHLVPVTFDASDHLVMPIQGEGLPLMVGNYGIRAMGIDTLFNVGSYTAPTHLRIVAPNDPAQINRASVIRVSIGDRNGDGIVDEQYEHGTIYANTTQGVELTIKIDQHPHFLAGIAVEYQDANGNWQPSPVAFSADELAGTQVGAEFSMTFDVPDALFNALLVAGDTVMVRAVATNQLQLTDAEPMEFAIKLDAGDYPPEVLRLEVDEASTTMRNPDSDGPQGMVTINAYTLPLTGPRTVGVRFVATQGDGAPIELGTATQSDTPGLVDAVDAAVDAAVAGADAPINTSETVWSLAVDTAKLLPDTITKDSLGARDASKDDNPYTISAFAVSEDGKNDWPSDATAMLSVDNVDDVGPLGPTNITAIANANGMVEADTHRGLVDENDPSVVPQSITLTIEPTAVRKTYTSVMLVSDPEINAALISDITETAEGSGVFMVTVDIGALGIEGNGTYKLHALVDDEPNNGQDGASPESTIHVKNYERPDPAVFKLMVDVGTQKNADSEGPQGTFMFTGYTIEQNSPPIESIRLEAKRANDTDWTTIGTGDASTSVDIEDAALPGVLDHLTGIVVEGTETGDKSVVAIDATNKQWVVSVDTVALALEDTITKDSPGARDVSKDDNQYTVRAFAVDASGKEWASDATAMFSLDNVDDVAPLAPTGISITSVDGVDTVFETAEDGSYTVGGLVDKYDDAVASPVATFMIEPVAARKTYKSVRLAMYPEGALVSEITETAEGSGVFTVTVDVGTLADGETYLEEGTYTFQALAKDEFDNEETDGSKISVTVDNDYRPAPEVLVVAVDPESITQTNPDSGAPQGTITLNSRSYEITSPPISGKRFEVKRPMDEEWIDVGTATESMMVSDVSDAELADFVGDVASAAASATEANESGELTVVQIDRSQTYQEWMLEVDTTTLEDTITADSPAARDASKDDNQYMVRVTAIAEADGSETMSADGITAHFSVDNVDDVSPVGPTNIVAVADVAGMIEANEDGSYTVGGIVDDTVPSPIATFTIEQTADPITYEGGSVNLVQTTADGTESTIEGEAGILDTITIDVGMLENGTYMFHALTVDQFGNVQTDESPMITVHVLNFRVSDVTDISVIAVDGTDVAEPPAEPIPLRNSVSVSFMVANGSLAAEELSGAVNGQEMPSESAEDPENTFSLMVEVGSLVDGVYAPDAVVTKRNGSVAFPVTEVNVDNTGPMITIESPTEDETVDSLPTIRATYNDGAGSGVDGATGSLAVARLQPPNEAEVVVDQAELEKDAASLVYTRREPLAGGAYRVTVQVTDNLGNVGEGSAEFAVNGTLPTVAIHSPASGQTFEHGKPLISGEFSGAGTVEVTTFTVNDDDATPEVSGNRFSYTPEEALGDGNHMVVVAVTDGDGNMAQTSVTFMVEMPKDTTPPVISSVAPTGLIKGANNEALGNTRVSAVVTDEQSAVSAVEFHINGVKVPVSRLQIAAGTIEAPVDLTKGPGLYTVRLKATSEGGTTEHVWTFTFAIDGVAPTISSITPNGTIRTETPTISASATDESGVHRIRISVFNAQNQQVKGSVENDGVELELDEEKGEYSYKGEDGDIVDITRADFIPENPLTEGTYLIIVDADDTLGNTATARGSFTIDFDTAAPIITMASPHQNARFKLKPGDKAPTVSIAYADAESGIDVDSITLVIEGVDSDYKATPSGTKITFQSGQKSASQVMHPLLVDTNAKPETWAGEYVVRLEVADKAHLAGYVSAKNKGTREANRTVHTFSFFLEAAEGPILASRPLNYPNPFKDNTRISFTLARQATVSIVIYDITLRPVRVLVDNRVFDAGNYTLKENGSDAIGWDGTSSSGEDLARGIYFCEIIVADGFEPEYAILKLALTR